MVATYSDLALAGYEDSLTAAKKLREAINALVAKPSADTLKAAREAWIVARVPYQQTEAYRFGNPIVDDWEGRVNAWPLDEGLIDYVDASYGTENDENAFYAVNVIGPTAITAAALPHLAPDALVSFLSSESTTETRWGMSAYTAAKAALEATIRSWRVEHPERRFQRIVMGATMPTDFGNGFGEAVLTTAFDRWAAAGVSMTFMETDEVGRHLAETMAVLLAHPTIDVPDLCLDPRGEAWAQGAT